MKTVLVTGPTGFVGQELSRALLRRGWSVRGAVRSTTAVKVLPERVETVRIGEINAGTDWSEALIGVDGVVHLAARVHVMKETVQNPLLAFREVNVDGTERLARAAAAAGVERFVYLSSVKVNGEGSLLPYTEQQAPDPQDAYGKSKWEAEQVLRKIAVDADLKPVILRPPLVYGPGVKANFLQLLSLVSKGVPLPFDGVRNLRSFLGVGNLVDAIMTCMEHPEAVGQTYLVSDGEDISTAELIRRIARSLRKPARLFAVPQGMMRLAGRLLGKSGAVERLLGSLTVDVSKIRRELGWQAPHSMAQELRATADWFRNGKERNRQ